MANKAGGALRRLIAIAVATAIGLGAHVNVVLAAGPAGNVTLRGAVAAASNANAVAGARVYAVHLDTKQVFTSAPSGPKGEYQITGLPFGYYDIAVETPEGLYLANRVINAPAGEKIDISLMLGPPQPEDTEWWSAEPDRRIPGLDRVPDGVARIVEGKPRAGAILPGGSSAAAAGGSRFPWWGWALAGVGVVGLFLLLDDDDDNPEPQATPFAP